MFIVKQIYSESAADACERFTIELKLLQLLGHLLPNINLLAKSGEKAFLI